MGDHESLRVFQLGTMQLLFERATEGNAIIGLEFSPDSSRLAAATSTSGNDGLWLLDITTGQVVELDTKDAARQIAFSPNGRRLLAADFSGRLTIWQDGREPATVYRPFDRGILGAGFLGDGSEVLGVAFGSGLAVVATPPPSRSALLEQTGQWTNLRVCRSNVSVISVDPGGPTDAFAPANSCPSQ